jgi:hypothetical protein
MTLKSVCLAVVAAGFGAAVLLPSNASAAPSVDQKVSARSGLVQLVDSKSKRRRHDDDDDVHVRAPFASVDVDDGGTYVEAPFTSVHKDRYGTHVRAPFVDLWIPRR